MSAFKKPRLISTLLLPVFIPAVMVIIFIIIGTLSNPELAGQIFADIQSKITKNFSWFYMLVVATFLVFVISLVISPWGNIKLGPDDSEPDYTFTAWFAMLFSAGYGIALLFFGVAEPVLHYANPPEGPSETVASAPARIEHFFRYSEFFMYL